MYRVKGKKGINYKNSHNPNRAMARSLCIYTTLTYPHSRTQSYVARQQRHVNSQLM